ncbi:MAG: M81 family metallopeptidase [Rhizomicrobium sp.]
MKFYCASISHETSRFSPIPTNLDSYREGGLYLPSTGEGADLLRAAADGTDWVSLLRALGHDAVCGPIASAQPSRPTSKDAYQTIRRELLESLRAALPVDGVLLFLHGAQVAEDVDDCEGDILAAVRAIVGPGVPVGVEMDLHGNVSDAMVGESDILLSCLEYPHTDFGSRARQLAGLVVGAAAGAIRPVNVRRRVPMLGTYYTTAAPMREFVDWAKAFEGKDGILGVSVTHGFAWADIADCGAGVVVCADGNADAAAALADTIAERYFALRDAIRLPPIGTADALAQALAHQGRPVVIADITDNPGAGAAGDSTFLLRALLEAGVEDTAVGMIWDPIAVEIAHRAGVGARLAMRIGGKTGPGSGPPLDLDVTVRDCRSDATQIAQGYTSPLGATAVVQAAGIRIVLNSIRQQVFDTACFEAFGIDPRRCRIVAVKSQQHFYEAFGPFASKVIYAAPPGTVNMDYGNMTFQNVPSPIYPRQDPPFRAFGRDWRA